jgi:hypothetical protein
MNPFWLELWQNRMGEVEDAFKVAHLYTDAYAVVHQHDINEERPLADVLRALYDDIQTLNRYFEVGVQLIGEKQELAAKLVRAEQVATDFCAKNEALRAENAELRAHIKALSDQTINRDTQKSAQDAEINLELARRLDQLRERYHNLEAELNAAQKLNRDLTHGGAGLWNRLIALRAALCKLANDANRGAYCARDMCVIAQHALDVDDASAKPEAA